MLNYQRILDYRSCHDGRCKSRSYYIPFDNLESAQNDAWQNSRKLQLLNGEWDFECFEDINEVDESVLSRKLSDKIKVPSCVQMENYDKNQYTNYRYPFPFDPPFIHKKNPVFAYCKSFSMEDGFKRVFLNFEGADSCLYLYVNKKYAGFTQVSHSSSEFEITKFLRVGENQIHVFVAKWCVGSYFEDQDKWRFSGIFRNVYLLSREYDHIFDYKVNSAILGSTSVVRFELSEEKAATMHYNGKKYPFKDKNLEIQIDNAKFWNAERPHLYNFTLEYNGEFILEKVGIREISVRNKRIELNGAPILLKGVNRHEFNPKTGAAVSEVDMLNDLKLLKEHNVNAIRTSHYPSSPIFYKMCDELGFYVMDEADMECHGVVMREGGYNEKQFNYFADDEKWLNVFLDRAERLVSRDKNRTCVIFWSLGNESGYGVNFEKMADYVRGCDRSRLIHYEGLWAARGEDIYYTDKLDVVSRMYPEPQWLEGGYLNDDRELRPLVLCEYCHAMGNGPGDLRDYREIIERQGSIAGGFIWEWVDHAIDIGGEFKYGGDFGEDLQDGNFCVDGLIMPNRQIKSATLEMKACFSPIEVEIVGEREMTFKVINKYDFKAFDSERCVYVIRENGRDIMSGELDIRGIKSGGSRVYNIGNLEFSSFTNIVFIFCDKYEIYRRGFVLKDYKAPQILEKHWTKVFDEKREISLEIGNVKYLIEKSTGKLSQIIHGGEKLLLKPLNFNIFRAPTDNDMQDMHTWYRLRLDKADMWSYGYVMSDNGVTFDCCLCSDYLSPHLKFKLCYTLSGDGLMIESRGEIAGHLNRIPRLGFNLALSDSFDNYEYLGLGQGESYIDKNLSCYKDIFKASVKGDYVRYIKPQESSSHYSCNFFRIDNREHAINIFAANAFSFSAVPYSCERIAESKHDYELTDSDRTYINIDYKMAGLGSHACGPVLAGKYAIEDRTFAFAVTMKVDYVEDNILK